MIYLYHVNVFKYYELKDQLILGRTSGDIVIADGMMSGKHAQISLEDVGGYHLIYVEDLGSKNRTVVNRIELPPLQRSKVKLNSLLEVGSQQFIITDIAKLSIQDINTIMDHYKSKPVIKLDPNKYKVGEATRTTSVQIPDVPVDGLALREEKIGQAKKELAGLEAQMAQELKKLEEMKEKLLLNTRLKKDELTKKIATLELDFSQYKDQQLKIKDEIEQKKKKIINLKDLPVPEDESAE